MGILPPLPEKGEGLGEGGLVEGNVPIGSAALFIFPSPYPSPLLGRGNFVVLHSPYPSHFGEREVSFLLPTAKPEAPLF